jgi:hypothetical protein
MEKYFNEKITLLLNMKKDIDFLLEKIQIIFKKNSNININTIQECILSIDNIINIIQEIIKNNKSNINDNLMAFDYNMQINLLIDIINKKMCEILNKKINIETFLSQTYIEETQEYYKKTVILFNDINKKITDIDNNIKDIILENLYNHFIKKNEIYDVYQDSDKILINFEELLIIMDKFKYLYHLYGDFINKLLNYYNDKNKNISYDIINIVEKYKNINLNKLYTSNNDTKKIPYDNTNPYYKSFGLIEITNSLSMQIISNLLFKVSVNDIKSFTKLCIEKKYDFILITNYSKESVDYNIVNLLNYEKSKELESSSNDGINTSIIDRFNTINYLDKKNEWKINYKYYNQSNDNNFVVILKTISNNKYIILSNYFKYDNYFVRKSNITQLLEFIKNKSNTFSRVHIYNNKINKNIVDNMFLRVKPKLENLKIKSQIIYPKYLRNTIFVQILNLYKSLYKKNINNIYKYSELVHHNEFLKIFSNIIMNEFYIYLLNHIDIYEEENIAVSEIYSSFIPVISKYERDFKKKIHDNFIYIMNSIDEKIFNLNDNEKEKQLYDIFSNILKDTINKIITNENNIFSTLIYKLYLFKLSLLD